MRRLELFELHDHPWFPAVLRDLVTDALQAIWDFGNSYGPILPLLNDALAQTNSSEIVDLCSGGGGPWFRLVRNLAAGENSPVTVRLTDKYPNREAFEKAFLKSGQKIGFDPRPVPATEVPADLHGFRTMFSAFHHFPPVDARKILADATECRKGIAIFETARRDPKTLLAVCFIPFLILLLTPQIRPFRWLRLLWTYVIPIIPFTLFFDGIMSCLRAYSHQELNELTQNLPHGSYRWQLGTQRGGLAPVTYLIGYPVAISKPSP